MSAFGPKRTSLVAPHMSAFGFKAEHKCLLLTQSGHRGPQPVKHLSQRLSLPHCFNPLPVEAAFSAGGPVLANRRRVTVEPATAAFPAVADVRAAVGVLAGTACALGDCAFPVAALSAAGDAMSVADEVAADERRAAPAAHCLAVLDGLQVARDVRHRAVLDDLHRVALVA